jgi:SAM-dependent methyltransferase
MSASPFIAHWAPVLARETTPPRRALDVAMGRGRHALVLARAGFHTYGVDANRDAVAGAVGAARTQGLRLRAWCADLTQYELPRARFQLLVVCRYLQRDLFPSIRAAVVPGGFVVYETFTEDQRPLGTGPTSPDHLLRRGELRQRFTGFEIVFYEEVFAPEAVARLIARRGRDA